MRLIWRSRKNKRQRIRVGRSANLRRECWIRVLNYARGWVWMDSDHHRLARVCLGGGSACLSFNFFMIFSLLPFFILRFLQNHISYILLNHIINLAAFRGVF